MDPHLPVIAKAVVALDSSTFRAATPLEKAALRLAYQCLRGVILGGRGLDITIPTRHWQARARLRRETYHFTRADLRATLAEQFAELNIALRDYPDVLPPISLTH